MLASSHHGSAARTYALIRSRLPICALSPAPRPERLLPGPVRADGACRGGHARDDPRLRPRRRRDTRAERADGTVRADAPIESAPLRPRRSSPITSRVAVTRNRRTMARPSRRRGRAARRCCGWRSRRSAGRSACPSRTRPAGGPPPHRASRRAWPARRDAQGQIALLPQAGARVVAVDAADLDDGRPAEGHVGPSRWSTSTSRPGSAAKLPVSRPSGSRSPIDPRPDARSPSIPFRALPPTPPPGRGIVVGAPRASRSVRWRRHRGTRRGLGRERVADLPRLGVRPRPMGLRA